MPFKFLRCQKSLEQLIEIYNHLYSKRLTSGLRWVWPFLNDYRGYNWHKTTSSVWIMNSERKVMGTLGHVIPIIYAPFALMSPSNYSGEQRRLISRTAEEGDTRGEVHGHSSIYPWEILEVFRSAWEDVGMLPGHCDSSRTVSFAAFLLEFLISHGTQRVTFWRLGSLTWANPWLHWVHSPSTQEAQFLLQGAGVAPVTEIGTNSWTCWLALLQYRLRGAQSAKRCLTKRVLRKSKPLLFARWQQTNIGSVFRQFSRYSTDPRVAFDYSRELTKIRTVQCSLIVRRDFPWILLFASNFLSTFKYSLWTCFSRNLYWICINMF